MKAGRPADPNTPYRVTIHTCRGYSYAVTRVYTEDPVTGKKTRKYVQWGRLTEVDGRQHFCPNLRFTTLAPEERERLIFPDDWDLSEIGQAEEDVVEEEKEEYVEADQDRLYGDVWLLEQIARKLGLTRDLKEAVFDDQEKAVSILSLAMFMYLTKEPLSHMEQWQDIAKYPAERPLTPTRITRLTQSITEGDRMRMFQALRRHIGKGALCAVDSTSRSGYGTTLSDLAYGKSKDHLDHLKQTTEVVVYALNQHIPVFYHTFPGNIPDSRSLSVILRYLQHAGYKDLVLITDRGYESQRNLQQCILQRQALVTAARVGQKSILEKIRALGEFSDQPPGMEWLPREKVFARQYDLEVVVRGRGGKCIPSNKLRLNLYYSPLQRTTAFMDLADKLAEQERELSEMVRSEAVLEDKNMRKYRLFTIKRAAETNVVLSYERNEKKIRKHIESFGFFAIETLGVDWSVQETISNYHMRDEQEKYFTSMKTRLHADRHRNWSELAFDGERFIEFVALILASYCQFKWGSTALRDTFRGSFDIMLEMRKIHCIEHAGKQKVITPFVGKQLQICEAFGIDVPTNLGPTYISKETTPPWK